MDCLLQAVFEAQAGREIAADVRMVAPPAFLDGRGRPRSSGKLVYGDTLGSHVDTDNFTVQWADPSIDPARAEAIAGRLEDAWRTLVEEGGWAAPVSSETYLLWVVLDTTLQGSGYTTTYTTAAYPEGYPVVYLNPVYYAEEYPDFALSVAVHEFAHALQFRHRDHATDASAGWYWEATAEWLAEIGAPDIDTYALSSYWYARAPEFAFDSAVNSHQYGMVALNAFLDEKVFGTAGIRDTWIAAGVDPEATWDTLISQVSGQDFATLMTAFGGEYAARTLRESAHYYEPLTPLVYTDGWVEEDLPEPFGTWYVEVAAIPAGFAVEGPVSVVWAVPGVGWSTTPPAEGPAILALTAVDEGESVRFGVPPDTGATDSGGEVSADTGTVDCCKDEGKGGCGCGTAGGLGWIGMIGGMVGGVLAGLVRRRR